MNHFATAGFWHCHRNLPQAVRDLADKNFALLLADPHHRSLRLKRVGPFWSARVGIHYRALARNRPEGLVWFFIGHHTDYERLIRGGSP